MPTWMIKELPPLGRTRRLRLSGDVDAPRGLSEALATAGRPQDPLLVDVSHVTHLSPAGLRALAREEHTRAVRGAGLELRGAVPAVQRTLARAGLLHLLELPDQERATA